MTLFEKRSEDKNDWYRCTDNRYINTRGKFKSKKEKRDMCGNTNKCKKKELGKILFFDFQMWVNKGKDNDRCQNKSKKCKCKGRDILQRPFKDWRSSTPNDMGADKCEDSDM